MTAKLKPLTLGELLVDFNDVTPTADQVRLAAAYVARRAPDLLEVLDLPEPKPRTSAA